VRLTIFVAMPQLPSSAAVQPEFSPISRRSTGSAESAAKSQSGLRYPSFRQPGRGVPRSPSLTISTTTVSGREGTAFRFGGPKQPGQAPSGQSTRLTTDGIEPDPMEFRSFQSHSSKYRVLSARPGARASRPRRASVSNTRPRR